MAETTKIVASERTDFGKGAARRARRDKNIPVVIYGGTQSETRHLLVPSHETFLALKDNFNAVIELDVDGDTQLALTKDVQLHPVRRTIEHVDFVAVRRGERVTVDVPVHATGESAQGTIHVVDLSTLTITAPATSIPEAIVVDIEGLEDGTSVRVSDLTLPSGVTTDVDADTPVVNISTPQLEAELEELEAEVGAGAAGQEAAEGEDAEGETSEDAEGEQGEGSEENSEG